MINICSRKKDMEQIIYTTLTESELTEIIKECLKSELQQSIPNTSDAVKEEYLTRKEASGVLRISLPTLHQLIKSNTLTAYRIGGRVLLNKSEVLDSIRQINISKYKRDFGS